VVPAVLTDPRDAELAQTHLDLVGDHGSKDQVLPRQAEILTERERTGDDVGWVAGVGFPVNVVVVHRPDHVIVQKGRIDRVGLVTRHKAGALAGASHRLVVIEEDVRVFLAASPERAPERVVPEKFGGLNRSRREVVERER